MNKKFQSIDLIKKFDCSKNAILKKIQSLSNFSVSHPIFKIGDIIKIVSGLYDDIIYTIEIAGFDMEENVYFIWDCYWVPYSTEKIETGFNVIKNIDYKSDVYSKLYKVIDEMAGEILIYTDNLTLARDTAYNHQAVLINNQTDELIYDYSG